MNEHIGRTGAGLKSEDVTPGSEIANIIGMLYFSVLQCYFQPIVEKEMENFKWWPRLHGYWCMLPNFNPYTISSNLGQDLADEALLVLMGDCELGDIGLVCV